MSMLLSLLGCGAADNIPKADISGVVTLDGAPLAGVSVHFINEETGFAGFGKTDSEGRYSLVQGAAVGSNRVIFEKFNKPAGFDEDPESGMDEGQLEAMSFDNGAEGVQTSVGNQIPDIYGDNSTLKYQVTASDATDADFKLLTPK